MKLLKRKFIYSDFSEYYKFKYIPDNYKNEINPEYSTDVDVLIDSWSGNKDEAQILGEDEAKTLLNEMIIKHNNKPYKFILEDLTW